MAGPQARLPPEEGASRGGRLARLPRRAPLWPGGALRSRRDRRKGRDEAVAQVTGATRKRTKVAIVGGGPTAATAPLADRSWEIWTFGRAKRPVARYDRWFEMHSVPQLKALRGDRRTKMRYPEYWRFLRRLRCPVYMQKRFRDIPASVPYPLERAIQEFGRCFTSTVSYMIALAIMEGCTHLGLWGIDLTDQEEYLYQRPAVEYLLGVAAARGIAVVMPPSCTLPVPLHPRPVYTKVLYGYDWDHPGAWWNRWKKNQRKEKAGKENQGHEKTKAAPAAGKGEGGAPRRKRIRRRTRKRTKKEVKKTKRARRGRTPVRRRW